jgi:hypothetical protein
MSCTMMLPTAKAALHCNIHMRGDQPCTACCCAACTASDCQALEVLLLEAVMMTASISCDTL